MHELDDLDPFDLLDHEAGRLDRFFGVLEGDEWSAPTRCAGWTRHDLLAHLAASEEYNHACLDDSIDSVMERSRSRGVTDLHGYNAMGVDDRRGRPHDELLAEWRAGNGRTRAELRARRTGDLPTLVGTYPVRLQAFHLAAELATHADDAGVTVQPSEAAARARWRARVAKFMLDESRPENEVTMTDGGWRVPTDADDVVVLDDGSFADAVNGREADAGASLAGHLRIMP